MPVPTTRRRVTNSPERRTAVTLLLTVIAISILSPSNAALALTIGFLPGDACYGSRLSQKTLAQFGTDGQIVFPYSSGVGLAAGCGYAGYWNLAVGNMPKSMTARLHQVYWHLREFDPPVFEIRRDKAGNERRREMNAYRVFIYDKDYDLGDGIGLKFNEDWMHLIRHDTRKPYRAAAYSPYVTAYNAIARDWDRAPRIPPLQINEKDALPLWGPRIEEPLSIDAARIQILILPDGLHASFAEAMNASPEEELEDDYKIDSRYFYRVTDEGVTRCHWNSMHELVEEAWPIDPAILEARERSADFDDAVEDIERAYTETFGIDDDALPVEVRRKLERLREDAESLLDDLWRLAEGMQDESNSVNQRQDE